MPSGWKCYFPFRVWPQTQCRVHHSQSLAERPAVPHLVQVVGVYLRLALIDPGGASGVAGMFAGGGSKLPIPSTLSRGRLVRRVPPTVL